MMSIVKLIGISSCCLAIGATAADAEPTVLADAELDRVVAGFSCLAGTDCPYLPGGRLFLHLDNFPSHFPSVPGGPQPHEPAGCETGACRPGPPDTLPALNPIAPIDFPQFDLILLHPPPGGYCGPACDRGPVEGQLGR